MKPRHILPILAVVALAACAQFTNPPQPVERGTLVSASAVVESIDHASRRVQLRDASTGAAFTVVAGPEVRNLAQVQAGDTVNIDFYESTALAMADPADPGDAVTTVATATPPAGALPGGLAAVSTSVVVTVVRYDRASGLATFTTPDGVIHRATVPPELRSFAEARQPGQRVLLTLTDAVAITMTPAAS